MTPPIQFSLDRKRRSQKKDQCSAFDSVGLIFIRSYRSSLLNTTPTTTPSLVKTSLKKSQAGPGRPHRFNQQNRAWVFFLDLLDVPAFRWSYNGAISTHVLSQ